jgi:serine/threonine protein kinase
MGNKQKEITALEKPQAEKIDYSNAKAPLSKNNYDFLFPIGKGGFGKVWRVTHKKYKTSFALKEMSKAKIIDKRLETSIISEKDILSKLRHPFIVNMHYAFQDTHNLYLIIDLLTGGDGRYHLTKLNQKKQTFTEEQAKFFVACIVLALDYTHSNNILHRDLKPENFVFDNRGYLRLTDYGIAKVFNKENAAETSGTPGYMAPEVMCGQNHTIAVDYFALGVYTFELMFGVRPYNGKSRSEIKEKMLSKQVIIRKSDIPSNWSVEAADFINRVS